MIYPATATILEKCFLFGITLRWLISIALLNTN